MGSGHREEGKCVENAKQFSVRQGPQEDREPPPDIMGHPCKIITKELLGPDLCLRMATLGGAVGHAARGLNLNTGAKWRTKCWAERSVDWLHQPALASPHKKPCAWSPLPRKQFGT